MIDRNSCVKIISRSVVETWAKPHPQPYVTLIGKKCHSYLALTNTCSFFDIMIILVRYPTLEVAHILLDRPWLYDLEVKSFGKPATIFMINGKKVVLTPSPYPYKSQSENQKNELVIN